MKTLVENYFSLQLLSRERSYAGLMDFEDFEENKSKVFICPKCQPYCILSTEDLVTRLTELQTSLRSRCTPIMRNTSLL
jgi:hypothetical protein